MKDKDMHQSLEDQGWAAMSDILNKEMPAGGKRRHSLWLWCLLGGLLLSGGLGYALWASERPVWGMGCFAILTHGGPQNESIGNGALSDDGNAPIPHDGMTPPSEAYPTATHNAARDSRGGPTQNITTAESNNSSGEYDINFSSDSLEGYWDENATNRQRMLAAHSDISNENIMPAKAHGGIAGKTHSPYPIPGPSQFALLENEIPPLLIQEKAWEATCPPLIEQADGIRNNLSEHENTSMRWLLEMGYVFSNKNETGARMGAFVQIPVGHSLSIRTGWQYQYLLHTENGASEQELSNELTTPDVSNAIPYSAESVPRHLRIRKHYVKIPVELGCHLRKAWVFRAGASGSCLFRQKSDSVNFRLPGFLGAAPEVYEGRLFRLRPRWDIHAKAGITYHLPKGWSIGLDYEQGLRPLYLESPQVDGRIPLPKFRIRNRWVGVSIARGW